jgi:hypothetical protein
LCHVVIEHTLVGAVSRIDRNTTVEEISSNQRRAEDRLRSSAKR